MGLPAEGVWLDVRATQGAAKSERGISRYIAEQAKAIFALEPGAIAGVGTRSDLPVHPLLQPLSEETELFRPVQPPRSRPPAIYHVMSPFELDIGLDELWPRWARRPGVQTVVTLYDLIPWILHEQYLNSDAAMKISYRARMGLVRSAHQVLAISRRTAEDAVEQLGIASERVTVIDSAVSGELPALVRSAGEAEALLTAESRGLRHGFLLYVGGDEPRKNLEGLFAAYGRLPQDLRGAHQLVVVCRMSRIRKQMLKAAAAEHGIAPRDVHFTGLVSDRVLAALYRCCALFVFPSLYEGAGLPILEAMSCGAPVAASANSSIPEILGDFDATFDPADPGEIAACLQAVLTDPARLEALRVRSRERFPQFTWERVGLKTLEGYRRALRPAAAAAPV